MYYIGWLNDMGRNITVRFTIVQMIFISAFQSAFMTQNVKHISNSIGTNKMNKWLR